MVKKKRQIILTKSKLQMIIDTLNNNNALNHQLDFGSYEIVIYNK